VSVFRFVSRAVAVVASSGCVIEGERGAVVGVVVGGGLVVSTSFVEFVPERREGTEDVSRAHTHTHAEPENDKTG